MVGGEGEVNVGFLIKILVLIKSRGIGWLKVLAVVLRGKGLMRHIRHVDDRIFLCFFYLFVLFCFAW